MNKIYILTRVTGDYEDRAEYLEKASFDISVLEKLKEKSEIQNNKDYEKGEKLVEKWRKNHNIKFTLKQEVLKDIYYEGKSYYFIREVEVI